VTRHGEKRTAAIAIKLADTVAEHRRDHVRAMVAQLARDARIDSTDWDDRYVTLVLKGASIEITQTTWEVARRLHDMLLVDQLPFQMGVELGDSESDVRGSAETLAMEARSSGIALFARRLDGVLDPPWSEIEVEHEIAHYPAIGRGLSGSGLAAQTLGMHVGRYVARNPAERGDLDAEGFLQPALGRHRLIGELVRERYALILGEPWLGKSWVAERLRRGLAKHSSFVWRISFERARHVGLPADEWARWQRSDQHAYVIVDALDEGFDRSGRFGDQDVADHLRRLRLDNDCASRLHVLAFSRTSHEKKSLDALGWGEAGKAATWHLMPLDADQAARALDPGDHERGRRLVQRVREHVRRIDDPLLVRDYYVLTCLANADVELSLAELEQRVVETLCEPREEPGTTREDRVRAAAHIAAVLQFSGVETIDLVGEHGHARRDDGSPVGLYEALPKSSDAHVARALARSDLFEHMPGYGYRFRQQFAKERLAAYALRRARVDLVRRLISGPRGGLTLAHKPVMDRLIVTEGELRPALRELAVDKARPLREQEARQVFQRILEAGRASIWHLRNGAALSALSHPSIASLVVGVLGDSQASEDSKELALGIARTNADADGWEHVPDAVLMLALDPVASSDLRLHAVLFICWADSARAQRPRLDSLLDQSGGPGATSEERNTWSRIHAAILSDRLERGASVLEVATAAPEAEPSVYDSRSALLLTLAEKMSDDDAREILDQRFERVAKRLPGHVIRELEKPAIQRLRDIRWVEADVERVRSILDTHRDGFEAAIEWNSEEPALRRRMFAAFLERHAYRVALRAEDADWLADYAERAAHGGERLARECCWFVRRDDINESARARLESWLSARHADVIGRIQLISEANRQRNAEWRKERTEKAEAERAERRMLRDVLREALDSEASPQSLIWWLGSSVFEREGPRQPRTVGSFADQAPELRHEVMRRLIEALQSVEPTPVPTSSVRSYPSKLAYEATAFGAAVLSEGISWLTGSIVRGWLPCVLFVPGEEREAVVAACYRAAERETQDVLLEALRREATGEEYSNAVDELPEDAVQDLSFRGKVLDIAASSETRAGAREDIVFKLASRIGPGLRTQLMRAHWPSDARSLIGATVSYLADGAKIEAVLKGVSLGDTPSFLQPLYRYPGPWLVDLGRWRSVDLAGLASWLVERFSFETDPSERADGFVELTAERKARELRDHTLSLLMERQDDDANRCLDDMAAANARLKRRLDQTRSTREIDSILAEIDPKPARPRAKDVAEMLEEGAPTHLRSDDDLYYVLLETLDQVASEIGRDTNLVWREPKKGGRLERNEDRLRNYLRLQLEKMLKLQGVSLDVVEEKMEGYGDRPDLIATLAERPPGSEHRDAGVAIEIKWSHDDRVVDDIEKLAINYVVEQHRAHGIYVLGFTGRVRNTDRTALEGKLRESIRLLESKQVGIKFGLVVLPVARPVARKRSRSRKRSGPRKRSPKS
jgi:hypothetical protein